MPPRTPCLKPRAIAMSICMLVLSAAFHTPARAAEDDLPPDDGAPPEEYAPTPGAELAENTSPWRPSSPPVDNAFPIADRRRSSCSNDFGAPRSDGRTHMGVDCFAPLGTPLVAAETGTIRYATPGEPFSCASGGDISGNRVSVRGRSGYVYYYGHLDTILVATDEPVQKGQVIGTVGRTGNASCSTPHLHFEVKCGEDGPPFDPYPLIGTWGSPGAAPTSVPSTELFGVGVALSGAGRQDLFALECGQAIRQKTWWSSLGLVPWYPVDGIAASDPDAASPGAGYSPQVFVRGTDSAAYLLNWSGSAWTALNLGGICTSGPSAAYSSPTHLDVFCRGSDRALYQRVWDASTGLSPGWSRVGGIATSDPDVASPGPAYPAEVFVRGYDGAIYQLYWNGSAWVTVNLGGFCTSGPSAAFSGPDRLDVFCRGSDLALYHRFWLSAIGWSGTWTRIESRILSDPEATSTGVGGLPQVFVRGMDRRLYQFSWNGSSWVSWIWGVT